MIVEVVGNEMGKLMRGGRRGKRDEGREETGHLSIRHMVSGSRCPIIFIVTISNLLMITAAP